MCWRVLLAALLWVFPAPAQSFRFAIFGDRTGEAQPGVYEQVWHEAAAEHPAFVVGVGDTIQGANDNTAEAEWRDVRRILAGYTRIPLYLAPGNHDVWSERSARWFRTFTGHPPHYSFDYKQAHFTVLDNSRSEEFSTEELAFLESDLAARRDQSLKFIISHRPSWIVSVVLRNPDFPLHRLAKKYGVRYVIAGHTHQMLQVDLEGVTYLSMASSGGHLRGTKRYEDGWFFGYVLAEVREKDVRLSIRELKSPHGQGRATVPADWGVAGLASHGR